ncbi:hypothetical protein A9168_16180 [Macellibacteroides sp. HH-ZS]|nr:hypothetical protein A9168_16180 [Macellibacteroides sp. HH-ZS]
MKMNRINSFLFLGGLLAITACNSDDEVVVPGDNTNETYALCLGVTSSNATSYYVVTANDLMAGTISPVGNGVEQTGYRDFQIGAQTVFSIGGMGVTAANAITIDENGKLQQKGNFVFDNTLNGLEQVNSSTMLGVEMPSSPTAGNMIKFYTVDINSVAITKTVSQPMSDLNALDWPSFTGMRINGDKVYLTYCLMNPTTYETQYTDTTFVAVYSYPGLQFQTLIKDTRTGPAGSWNANNGIIKTESGDMYIMSNSAISNGFSQSTKKAGFLRISNGSTVFDNSYFFNFEEKTGLKPAHIKYIGNGLLFAEVSTNTNQTLTDRWGDKNLKFCIINLYNQTVTDVTGAPVHDGNGGRSFTALVDNGYVYHPVSTENGVFIYRIDPTTATAVKGAEVLTTFVGGFFRIK